jgi:hypothetical protein
MALTYPRLVGLSPTNNYYLNPWVDDDLRCTTLEIHSNKRNTYIAISRSSMTTSIPAWAQPSSVSPEGAPLTPTPPNN